MPPIQELPPRAQVVIIGGGIVGCSVAYHLSGARLEGCRAARTPAAHLRHDLARSGSGGPVAGDQQPHRTGPVHRRSLPLELEAETGQATGFKQNGSISVAKTEARLEELKRGASMGKTFGLRIEVS